MSQQFNRSECPPDQKIPVDGHVHFHRVEQVAGTLDSAIRNFRAVTGECTELGVLLLNEAAGERIFDILCRQSIHGRWQVIPCGRERHGLICRSSEGTIIVISGRQVRCKGGLEVAALGTTEEYPEGCSFEETIARVRESGAITVLPWGFGKWMGSRGAEVRQVLERRSPSDLAVGDNGGRLSWTGQPTLVRWAAQHGYVVVPGSDPFPFGRDFQRVGSFGFCISEPLDLDAPWSSVSTAIANGKQTISAYGDALGLTRFMINQTRMQVYNAGKRRPGV